MTAPGFSVRIFVPSGEPDGLRTAFFDCGGASGIRQVCLVDADGSNVTWMPNESGVADQLPAWSPDGSKITFDSWGPVFANSDIMIIGVDGSSLTNLTNNPAQDGQPSWQPLPAVGGIAELPSIAGLKADGMVRTDTNIWFISGAVVGLAMAFTLGAVSLIRKRGRST